MNLVDLASFVRVVELGTITAAAKAEGVGKSTISRRIARLEEALGVELVRRSARSFALTDSGRLLHERAEGALQELRELEHALKDAADEPTGRLRLTMVHDIGRSPTVASLIAEYRRLHRQVTVEVVLESRVVDIIAEGFDVALRAHSDTIPGGGELMARRLSMPPAGFFASPDYLRQRGAPRSLDELAGHDLVGHTIGTLRDITLQSPEGSARFSFDDAACVVNDFGLAKALVEAGAGIALLPFFSTGDSIDAGRLVHVLPQWQPGEVGRLTMLWPASRHVAPRVRAFVDLASERLGHGAWRPQARD